MKRCHRLGTAGAVVLVALAAAFLTARSNSDRLIIVLLPVVACGAVAAYLLVRLIHGVATFRSYPEALDELKREVQDARQGLKEMGIAT